MGGSFGKSSSDSENQASSDVWSGQSPALQQMYQQFGNLFNQSMPGMQNQIPGAIDNMGNVFDQASGAWNNQLQGGAYQGMDLQGNYNQALQGGGNEQFINESIMGGSGNNYVDAMKNQMQTDSDSRLGRSLAMNDARAAGAGMGGSSRHGMTESRLHEDSNTALGNLQTEMGFNTFDKDLERKLGIAQRADRFDMGRLENTSGMLQNQNNAMQGGLNFGQNMQGLNMGRFAPQMAPWQMANQYSNAIGPPVMTGQSSGDSSSKGIGFGGGAKG